MLLLGILITPQNSEGRRHIKNMKQATFSGFPSFSCTRRAYTKDALPGYSFHLEVLNENCPFSETSERKHCQQLPNCYTNDLALTNRFTIF